MAEREWRESADARTSGLILGGILAAAALLRFWALDHGVPYAIGVDEPEVVDRVIRMMKTGDFNPHFFHYPTLYFYLQLPLACLQFLLGASRGAWTSLEQFTAADFYPWARALTAALGTATVLLVYHAGLRWGTRHALLAAGLMAVMPMHVRESHYVLTDVPMTFFVTLTLVLTLVAHDRPTIAAFFWAGVAAGLAAATKYTAAVAVLLPVLTAVLTVPASGGRLAWLLAIGAGSAGAFLVAAPYSLLDLPAFLDGFADLSRSYRQRGPNDEPGWIIYLKYLRQAFGWPAMLLAAGGAGLALVRSVKGPGRVRWVLITVFPLVLMWLIQGRSLIYGRYVLPVVPFVCLLVGIAVISGVTLLRRLRIPRMVRTALIAALTVSALLPPGRQAVDFNRTIARTPTQGVAYAWMLANLPRGARVVIEKYDIRLPADRFRVSHVGRLVDTPIDAYGAEGVDFLVATSQVYGPALAAPDGSAPRTAYERLFAQATELARFTPTPGRPGPELRVLQVSR